MKEKLKLVEESFRKALDAVSEMKELENLKVQFLGKKGELSSFMKHLKDLPNDQKAMAGQLINKLKTTFQEQIDNYREELKKFMFERQMEKEWIDISLDPQQTHAGSLHPVTMVQQRLENIFESMGFRILDGPHIETEHYNFEALNIPKHHPARDMQDTFYFEDGHLLRTQTSTIQIHGMEKLDPPLRIVGPGKVFRCERTDASHDSCFHQLEGMMIDKGISVAHLIHFMQTMLGEVFERDNVKVRLRPGYFPFVEPGFELDMACQLCEGEGCSVCKKVGWIELLGCGMVHPNVLKAGNIDPNVYSGFAFGMGLDRLAMMKYGITDIRPLHGGNMNFMRRFTTNY